MTTKPLLKWVGGKTQILDKVLNNFPDFKGVYYEPFLGGGSILFEFLSRNQNKNNVVACDLNHILIDFYQHVQKKPEELYDECQKLINEFTRKDVDKEKEYYVLRKDFNRFY